MLPRWRKGKDRILRSLDRPITKTKDSAKSGESSEFSAVATTHNAKRFDKLFCLIGIEFSKRIPPNSIISVHPHSNVDNYIVFELSASSFVKLAEGVGISVLDTVAKAAGLPKDRHNAFIRLIDPLSVVLSLVEVLITEECVSRRDIWIYQNSLLGKVVYKGLAPTGLPQSQFVTQYVASALETNEDHRLLSSITGNYPHIGNPLLLEGHQHRATFSGIIGDETKFSFRSKCQHIIILIQLSQEMWWFSKDGCPYYKRLDMFLRNLFNRYHSGMQSHYMSFILYYRLRYFVPDSEETDERFQDYYDVIWEGTLQALLQNVEGFLSCLRQDLLLFPSSIGWTAPCFESKSKLSANSKVAANGEPTIKPKVDQRIDRQIEPTLAAGGCFFEAINLVLDQFASSHVDNSLSFTGQAAIFVTAGNGVFYSRDWPMVELAKQRISNSLFVPDVVCIRDEPLHAVPLLLIDKQNHLSPCGASMPTTEALVNLLNLPSSTGLSLEELYVLQRHQKNMPNEGKHTISFLLATSVSVLSYALVIDSFNDSIATAHPKEGSQVAPPPLMEDKKPYHRRIGSSPGMKSSDCTLLPESTRIHSDMLFDTNRFDMEGILWLVIHFYRETEENSLTDAFEDFCCSSLLPLEQFLGDEGDCFASLENDYVPPMSTDTAEGVSTADAWNGRLWNTIETLETSLDRPHGSFSNYSMPVNPGAESTEIYSKFNPFQKSQYFNNDIGAMFRMGGRWLHVHVPKSPDPVLWQSLLQPAILPITNELVFSPASKSRSVSNWKETATQGLLFCFTEREKTWQLVLGVNVKDYSWSYAACMKALLQELIGLRIDLDQQVNQPFNHARWRNVVSTGDYRAQLWLNDTLQELRLADDNMNILVECFKISFSSSSLASPRAPLIGSSWHTKPNRATTPTSLLDISSHSAAAPSSSPTTLPSTTRIPLQNATIKRHHRQVARYLYTDMYTSIKLLTHSDDFMDFALHDFKSPLPLHHAPSCPNLPLLTQFQNGLPYPFEETKNTTSPLFKSSSSSHTALLVTEDKPTHISHSHTSAAPVDKPEHSKPLTGIREVLTPPQPPILPPSPSISLVHSNYNAHSPLSSPKSVCIRSPTLSHKHPLTFVVPPTPLSSPRTPPHNSPISTFLRIGGDPLSLNLSPQYINEKLQSLSLSSQLPASSPNNALANTRIPLSSPLVNSASTSDEDTGNIAPLSSQTSNDYLYRYNVRHRGILGWKNALVENHDNDETASNIATLHSSPCFCRCGYNNYNLWNTMKHHSDCASNNSTPPKVHSVITPDAHGDYKSWPTAPLDTKSSASSSLVKTPFPLPWTVANTVFNKDHFSSYNILDEIATWQRPQQPVNSFRGGVWGSELGIHTSHFAIIPDTALSHHSCSPPTIHSKNPLLHRDTSPDVAAILHSTTNSDATCPAEQLHSTISTATINQQHPPLVMYTAADTTPPILRKGKSYPHRNGSDSVQFLKETFTGFGENPFTPNNAIFHNYSDLYDRAIRFKEALDVLLFKYATDDAEDEEGTDDSLMTFSSLYASNEWEKEKNVPLGSTESRQFVASAGSSANHTLDTGNASASINDSGNPPPSAFASVPNSLSVSSASSLPPSTNIVGAADTILPSASPKSFDATTIPSSYSALRSIDKANSITPNSDATESTPIKPGTLRRSLCIIVSPPPDNGSSNVSIIGGPISSSRIITTWCDPTIWQADLENANLSSRPLEWFMMHHDTFFSPPLLFKFSIEWLCCSTIFISRLLKRLSHVAKHYGFSLIQIPNAQIAPSSVPKFLPFHLPNVFLLPLLDSLPPKKGQINFNEHFSFFSKEELQMYNSLLHMLTNYPLSLLFLCHKPEGTHDFYLYLADHYSIPYHMTPGWMLMERHGLYFLHVTRGRVLWHNNYLLNKASRGSLEGAKLNGYCSCDTSSVKWRSQRIQTHLLSFIEILKSIEQEYAHIPKAHGEFCSLRHAGLKVT